MDGHHPDTILHPDDPGHHHVRDVIHQHQRGPVQHRVRDDPSLSLRNQNDDQGHHLVRGVARDAGHHLSHQRVKTTHPFVQYATMTVE